jgi:hypothetical protein
MGFTDTISEAYDNIIEGVKGYDYSAVQRHNTVEALTRLNMILFSFSLQNDPTHRGGYARAKSIAEFDWTNAWHNKVDVTEWSDHKLFNEFGCYKDTDKLNIDLIRGQVETEDGDGYTKDKHTSCVYSQEYVCKHIKKYMDDRAERITK